MKFYNQSSCRTKAKKRFIELTKKYLKIEKIHKHIWQHAIWEELLFRMFRKTCKMKVSMKFFLPNMHKDATFNWSGQACGSLIY